MIQLDSPIADLKGFGPKSAEKFTKLDLHTVGDLLLYFPFRYEDFKSKSIFELMDGEKAVITGTVVTPANVQYYGFKRNRLSFKIKQGEAVIAINFFNQPYLVDKFEVGAEVAIFGKWDRKKSAVTGMKVLAHVEDDMQPVYHVAQGVSQAQLIKAIKVAFDSGALNLLEESLPQVLMDKYRLMGRQEAVRVMHFPKDLAEYKQALRRIKFEELFYFQMNLQVLKAENKSETNGDVGSGKTVIASLAMYGAYTAGLQSALMVPTEILAEQHYQSLKGLFPELKVVLLTSGMKMADKKVALSKIESGEAQMIVGTHSLIQDAVIYHKLGLVITDEQHRFGVNQRRIFREKGDNPDVLMMTATPIPRTLAITAFGEMDVSIIDQMPAGRKTIITRWVKHEQLDTVLTWIKSELEKDAQVYFISPLIEESESLDLKNAVALHQELTEFFGDSATVALMHGRMKNDEKDQIMQDFKDKKSQILVSTTVIEVGVNVPNATVMVIMDADRFGLSQLHQLRGRVGRGDKQSYCVLVANPKNDTGKKRMQAMCETTDGFVLAEEDLKMRGSGEIFGTRQSGIPEFQVADIVEDYNILEEARCVASQIVSDPNWRENPDWQVLEAHLRNQDEFD